MSSEEAGASEGSASQGESGSSSETVHNHISLHNAASRLYVKSDATSDGYLLKTYRHASHDDVPYVELEEANAALTHVDPDIKAANYQALGEGKYSLKKTSGGEIVFDVKTQTIIVKNGALFTHESFPANNGIGGDPLITLNLLGESPKTKYLAQKETVSLSLAKYHMDIVEQDGKLYAPFALMNHLLVTPYFNSVSYSGRDYFLTNLIQSDRLSSRAFSSKNGFLFSVNNTQDSKIHFARKDVKAGEKYRFESTFKTHKGVPCGVELILKEDKSVRMVSTEEESAMGHVIDYTGTFAEEGTVLSLTLEPGGASLADERTLRIDLGEGSYYAKSTRSKEMAMAHYYALCLQLDRSYGLKSFLNVESFDAYIESLGYKEKLLGTDVPTYYDTLSRFLYGGKMGDGHVTLISEGIPSTDPTKSLGTVYYDIRGERTTTYMNNMTRLSQASGGVSYKRSDDTLILSFYGFDYPYAQRKELDGYTSYTVKDGEKIEDVYFNKVSKNAFEGISMALNEALKDKTIKNIVFDITTNRGGYAMMVPLICGFMTDDPFIIYRNENTEGTVEAHYKVDLNGDGKFGQPDDTLKDSFKYYVLSAGASFSAANLFAAAVKSGDYATLIGQKSMGGQCAVTRCSDLTGYFYQYSSYYSFLQKDDKGVVHTAEGGIEPDIVLPEESLFNAEKIVEAIHNHQKA